jgi:hypothetical protein
MAGKINHQKEVFRVGSGSECGDNNINNNNNDEDDKNENKDFKKHVICNIKAEDNFK